MFKFTSSLALTSLVAAQNLLPETEDITGRELHFSADLSLLTYYKSQAECDALHHDSRYHYQWNSDACRCFHVFDIAYSFTCAAGKFYNPLHEAFDTTDLCINMSAYDLIFTNSLGPDCIDGTADDPSVPQTSNPNPTPPEPFAGFNNAACATAGYTNGGSFASAEIHGELTFAENMSDNVGDLDMLFYDGGGLVYFEEMCMSTCGDLVDPCTGICVTANVWGLPSGEVDDMTGASTLDYHQLAIGTFSIQGISFDDCSLQSDGHLNLASVNHGLPEEFTADTSSHTGDLGNIKALGICEMSTFAKCSTDITLKGGSSIVGRSVTLSSDPDLGTAGSVIDGGAGKIIGCGTIDSQHRSPTLNRLGLVTAFMPCPTP